MNNPYPAEDDSEHIEDVPTLSAQFSAHRAILNAQIQAKITDGTYKPSKIICRFEPSASFSKWLDEDPNYRLKLSTRK
jgi:PIN domain nuclease of toxin-antitoxin system